MSDAAQLHGGGEAALAEEPSLIDELVAGRSIEAIADARNYTRERTQRILRAELKAISIRPPREYAKLQIRRLETLIGKLTVKADKGNLPAVDRILKALDRLDRYHGFPKPVPKGAVMIEAKPEVDEEDDKLFDQRIAFGLERAKQIVEQRKAAAEAEAARAQGQSPGEGQGQAPAEGQGEAPAGGQGRILASAPAG